MLLEPILAWCHNSRLTVDDRGAKEFCAKYGYADGSSGQHHEKNANQLRT